MADVFVSYSRVDKHIAKLVVNAFEANRFSVWFDPRLDAGQRHRKQIKKELEQAKCVVVLWSSDSVESDWVVDEAEVGLARNVLVPALIESVEIPLGFRSIHTERLYTRTGFLSSDKLVSLVKIVEGVISRGPPPVSTRRTTPKPPPIHTVSLKLPADRKQAPGFWFELSSNNGVHRLEVEGRSSHGVYHLESIPTGGWRILLDSSKLISHSKLVVQRENKQSYEVTIPTVLPPGVRILSPE